MPVNPMPVVAYLRRLLLFGFDFEKPDQGEQQAMRRPGKAPVQRA